MRARVRAQAPNKICRAFNGLEYVNYEWRNVPEWAEGQARGSIYLELDDADPDTAVAEPQSPAAPKTRKPAARKRTPKKVTK